MRVEPSPTYETVQPSPTYETIAEAATRTGVSTKTVRRYIADGRLVGYRFGPRFIRLNPAEVDGLLRPIPSAAA